MTLVRVDFYTPSGKWYSGGEVEVHDSELWHDDFLDVIWSNQEIISTSEKEYYTVVTRDTDDNNRDPDYRQFFMAVLQVGRGRS
jgi:hypothetical protein